LRLPLRLARDGGRPAAGGAPLRGADDPLAGHLQRGGHRAGDEDEYLELAQAFRLFDAPANGAEVFSLMRSSPLESDEYLDAFFDTGSERAQVLEDE
jgi:hypothetical protein